MQLYGKLKYLLVVTCLCLVAHLAVSCKAQQRNLLAKKEPVRSDITLIPDARTKQVSTPLYLFDKSNIDYLLITRNDREYDRIVVDRTDLSEPYVFQYQVTASDPERIKFHINAHYRDGSVSAPSEIQVDNRWQGGVRRIERIARVTGNPLPEEMFPSPNGTERKWNLGGTDLGIVWEMSPGEYGVAFGDSYGRGFKPFAEDPDPQDGSWLCNVLAFSTDTDLSDGMTLDAMVTDASGAAREIIPAGKDKSGKGDWTSIPTAAIRANGADYIHYFNMKNWTGWVTNYSGMYKSTDDGMTWAKCENVHFGADSPFGQVGYYKKGGYVYMVGTETGRSSPARLARFREADIEYLDRYQYWQASTDSWVTGDEGQASVIIADKVGELSIIYNETHKKWFIAYFNSDRYNITMRSATDIQGPWSEPFELASGWQYPRLYGSYFHPLSSKGDKLYFLMSLWLPYNVFLMEVELAEEETVNIK